jgi:hypothetical protein
MSGGPHVMRWKNWPLAKRIVSAAAIAAVIAGGVAAWIAVPPRIEPDKVGAGVAIDPALIERGRYLAEVGDCVACHTAKGGTPMAGGLALETPFARYGPPTSRPIRRQGSADGRSAPSTGPCARACRGTAIASTRPCPIPRSPRSTKRTCARCGPISARGLPPWRT